MANFEQEMDSVRKNVFSNHQTRTVRLTNTIRNEYFGMNKVKAANAFVGSTVSAAFKVPSLLFPPLAPVFGLGAFIVQALGKAGVNYLARKENRSAVQKARETAFATQVHDIEALRDLSDLESKSADYIITKIDRNQQKYQSARDGISQKATKFNLKILNPKADQTDVLNSFDEILNEYAEAEYYHEKVYRLIEELKSCITSFEANLNVCATDLDDCYHQLKLQYEALKNA